MDFVTAEEKFNELQARIRRGEPMSEDQYQEELAKLMVQDDSGVFWSLEPGTGRWLYFNGTEWMPGMPPKQASVPPAAAAGAAAVAATVVDSQPPAADPNAYQAPSYQTPAYDSTPYQAPASSEPTPSEPAPSYYVPSDVTQPVEYSGTYTGGTSYSSDPSMSQAPYSASPDAAPSLDADGMPTYVRMPEPEAGSVASGGIPPRPVREASPLAVPGGERAWLPFAFGALVLLLCAVVLFFGVKGLPQFSGGTASQQPTEEPTEEQTDVLPTETVITRATRAPLATDVPATTEPEPTAAPAQVKASATDVLNIRQGPARTTASLGKLQPNQEVTVVGKNADGTWLQIQMPDNSGTGWVSAEFVTVTGDVNTLPVTDGQSGSSPQAQATETPTG